MKKLLQARKIKQKLEIRLALNEFEKTTAKRLIKIREKIFELDYEVYLKNKKKPSVYKYTVELFENQDITSFDCYRRKNYIATYTSPTDYYTLAGYNKLVVQKNKHVQALIKKTISKIGIYE